MKRYSQKIIKGRVLVEAADAEVDVFVARDLKPSIHLGLTPNEARELAKHLHVAADIAEQPEDDDEDDAAERSA